MGLAEMMTRAANLGGTGGGSRKLVKPALGNQKTTTPSGRGGVRAATQSVTYTSEGQPLAIDWNAEEQSRQAYLGQVYVMRGCRLIADTIAQLPWVAGPDPTDPSNYDKNAPLARLLGPSTPQAPGGPNPRTSSRIFWAWTIIQYLVTGRFGWECQLDHPDLAKKKAKEIVGLWPLVSAALTPKPTIGKNGTEWFNGFQYTPATGQIDLKNEEVVYCWRPSILDFRQPESVLSSASYPVFIANAINKYMANLLKNDLVPSTLVVTPPIEEADLRRAWQDQFLSEMSGVNNAGKTVFAEVEADEDDTTGKPLVQIEKLAQTVIDAQLLELSGVAKNDICIALGTPMSLMGDASGSTFDNSSQEWTNFWTMTLLNLITELQDHVNLNLAPRLDGNNYGWFDLSNVEALQPASIFTPPMITDVIQTGVGSPEQIAAILGIPPLPGDPAAPPRDSDTDTIERSMSWKDALMYRAIERELRFRQVNEGPVNTWTLQGLRKAPEFQREHINLRSDREVPVTRKKVTDGKGIRQAKALRQQALDTRALVMADRTTAKVHRDLAKVYPESTLKWVDGAEWSGPQDVKLDDVAMERRPGGRDQAKVKGIAEAIASGDSPGASAPVVLVSTPGSGKLVVADGYHRTLAHKRLGHATVPAYVAKVDDESGPWDREMHDKKLNRADELTEDDIELILDERSIDDLDRLGDELLAVT